MTPTTLRLCSHRWCRGQVEIVCGLSNGEIPSVLDPGSPLLKTLDTPLVMGIRCLDSICPHSSHGQALRSGGSSSQGESELNIEKIKAARKKLDEAQVPTDGYVYCPFCNQVTELKKLPCCDKMKELL